MDQVDDRFVRGVVELVGQVLEGKQEPGSATSRIRQAFFDQNPTTPDNVESIGLISLGATTTSDGSPAVGLKVGKENLSLSHIFWKAVESDEVAELIRKRFPSLTLQEAEAVLRVCTVVLTNLEGGRRPC
jgi:hypothetical protein